MLRLEKINGKNVWDILKLRVKEEQMSFVAGNDISIIEAYTTITGSGHAFPFGIYDDEQPVAVRMVYQVAQAVSLPIIGMGGICNGEDAIEFLLAGATAVSVGTANFANPFAAKEVVEGILEYMERYQVSDVRELIGAVRD